MSIDQIPFLDLVTPHRELEEELVSVFRNAIRSAAFVGGPAVENFEREFAEFAGARHSIGVANGTDALRFAIIAAGVRPGDTVVTVPNTFIATTEAISQAGARLDFVDVDERTYTLDPKKLQAYLETRCVRDTRTGRTIHRATGSPVTAVVPVHLYGQMADMDPIADLAAEYGLTIIEDACQAHGAEYFSEREQRWRKAGSIGAAAAFSFYPGKNLGACGEGGGITTNDDQIARHCRMLRDHGQSKKYFHDIEGYNGRLDSIQAGLLRVKLGHLAVWNEQRRAVARRYAEGFAGCDGIVVPVSPEYSKPVYHLYVVRVPNRDQLQAELAQQGISAALHYPVPLHMQKAYESLGLREGSFPVTERVTREILSLPMYPQLTVEQQARVIGAVRAGVARQQALV